MRIKDIAEALNLSISTVSKAITGAFDVSETTRQLVLNYVKECGYQTKEERKISKHRRRICILFDNMNLNAQGNIFYPLATSFSTEATANNCEVVIEALSNKNESFNLSSYLEDNKFDGTFIVGINYHSKLFDQLDNINHPVVLYDNNYTADNVSTVGIDNLNSISKIVSYLVSKGHRNIGFLNGEKHSFVSNERLAGYIIGLSNNNIEYNPDFVINGDYTKTSAENLSDFFLNKGITAVVCSSDLMAIGLIEGFTSKGIRVPEDISITGFDDLDIAEHIKPSLTTVRQDFAKMGKTAFELLSSLFINKSPQRVTLRGQIVERNSVIERLEK